MYPTAITNNYVSGDNIFMYEVNLTKMEAKLFNNVADTYSYIIQSLI